MRRSRPNLKTTNRAAVLLIENDSISLIGPMVGGHLEGIDPLGLHVAEEVHEVAAIRLDRVVGQQGIADPGD